jgi:hypothetical protein
MKRYTTKEVNQPIQLLGASLLGAVSLTGEFLYATTKSQTMNLAFSITAILIFPVTLCFILLMLVKYRDLLQADYFYYKSRQEVQKEIYEEQAKQNLTTIN